MAGFEVALTEKLEKNELALPQDFNRQRFVQNVIALSQNNDTLKEYLNKYQKEGSMQLLNGAMRAAYLNLDFMSKEAYLVPYGRELNFQIDYRGATKLAKKYSVRPVQEIYAEVVRQDDKFVKKIIDGKQTVDFEPVPFSSKEPIGVFAVCIFKDGGMLVETMNMDEIKAVRAKSKTASSKSSPWQQFPLEMMKKSAIHRLCKKIELDFANSEQVQAFNSEDDFKTIEEQVADDISENANTEEFVPEVEVEAEVIDSTGDDLPF